MRSIMIVDDEIISRLGIRNLIDWESYDYQIVAEASNGEEAMAVLSNMPIDLVITDINMPVMNGVQLIGTARKEGHEAEFLVLSSFDDYEYVRESLVLGALDYVLKLDLTPDLMVDRLNRADRTINLKKSALKSVPEKKASAEVNVKESLRQLLYGKLSYDTAKSQTVVAQLFESNCEGYYVICFDFPGHLDGEKRRNLHSLLEDILKDYPSAFSCMTAIAEVSVLFGVDSLIGSQKKVDRLANRIASVFGDFYNVQVAFFISECFSEPGKMPEAYLHTHQARALRNLLSDSAIIHYRGSQTAFEKKDYSRLNSLSDRLRIAHENKRVGEMAEAAKGILEWIGDSTYLDQRKARHLLTEMTTLFHGPSVKYLGKPLLGDGSGQPMSVDEVRSKEDLHVYIQWLTEAAEASLERARGSYHVRKVKDHIHSHYGEKVQIGQLAEHLKVSNSYLSVLFKRETGCTIKDYLLKVRVREAEQLLRDTALQVQEIAREVGCDNEHYFSTLFKQRTGMSPTEYRRQESEKQNLPENKQTL